MSSSSEDSKPERKFRNCDGQTLEVGHPRDLRQNQMWLTKTSMKGSPMLFYYSQRLVPSPPVTKGHLAIDGNRYRVKHQAGLIEPYGKQGERIVIIRGEKDTTKNPQSQIDWAHTDTQRLNRQPGNLLGTDLGPLYKCYSCVTQPSCETSNSESRGGLLL